MTLKDFLRDMAESRPVSKGYTRDTGIAISKGDIKTGLTGYDTDLMPRAEAIYSLANEMGVTGVYKSPELAGKGFDAYRKGSEILLSDEICPYKLPEGERGIEAVATYASKDPELAARLFHEIFEEAVPSRVGSKKEDDMIHADIHGRAYIAARNMGYEEAAREIKRIGSGFAWGQLSYDKLDEKLFGGPSLALYKSGYERMTGQPQLPPFNPQILTAPGKWMELLVEVSRAALHEWMNPDTDPVYGPGSVFGSEMKATGYGMSPISKLRPSALTYTLGPRREPEYEQVSMQQQLPGGGTLSRYWKQRRN